ncbi:MAG: ISAs1 family transposase [Phycisphaeraceae bacterium]|nr:ISAs1 family transposase [Phycisphaeraceae bacterium]
MDDAASRDLLRHFDDLPDPRAHNILHPMENILLIAIMAVTCGADDWRAVHRWGKAKKQWLATILDLTSGIPSPDTFRRFFTALDPQAFERCFLEWTTQWVDANRERLVAIDGKTLCGSGHEVSGQKPRHLISAWCREDHVVLGQIAAQDKSNEITAIPRLLEMLNLEGATVSIDAMGCQKDIARKIVEHGGDYLLAVKDNHRTLHEDIRFFFDDAIEQDDPHLVKLDQPLVELDHDRLETRQVWASGDVAWLRRQGHDWERLRGIVCVQGERQTFGPRGKTTCERRCYLTSHSPDKVGAQRLLEMVRGHWGVENSLHWSLDVSFDEDQRRLRCGHGAENFSRLCRIALNLLKAEKSVKVGIATRRLNCGWDNDYLLKVLMNLG